MSEPLPAPAGLPARYRILHRLGSGGMGDVYAAVDETLQRRVALKAIQAGRRLNTESQERFLREARILSQLDHPNICRAFDYIRGDESDWLVMELVEGWTLGDLIARKQMTDAEITKISEQIAAVLVVTHAAGIVHRDLKPGNVMITPSGDAKVLDFGIARARDTRTAPAPVERPATLSSGTDTTINLDATRTADHLSSSSDADETQFRTRFASTLGTLAYMSPEQALGEPATSASDMFSFGLLLQEMLTRKRAYDTTDRSTLVERVQNGTTVPIEGSGALAQLVRRLTSVAPSQRPTAVDAVERLRWIRETPKRRLRRTLTAAAAIIVVLASVKYTVDLRRERSAAIAAEEDANRRRGQAEALIGFMLGDLRTNLGKAGRLDLLEGVGAQAMTYFGSVPASSLTNEELSRRAQALYQIGSVRQTQGNLKDARAAYDESLAVARMVSARDPNNADWQLRLATAHFYSGDIRRREGELTGAMREFSAYRDIADSLAKRDPNNLTWALEQSYGVGGVAAVQELQGDLDGARQGLERQLGIIEVLLTRDPNKKARQLDLANTHNRIGVVLDKLGDMDGALAHFNADLEIRKALVATDPANLALKRQLHVAYYFLGVAHDDRGEVAAAMKNYQMALDIMRPLAEADPKNANWQRDVGSTERVIGDLERATGRTAEARARFIRADAILRPIAIAAPTDFARQRDLALVELGRGNVELQRGNIAAARAAAASIDQLLAALYTKKPDEYVGRTLANGRLLSADAAQAAGDRTAARTLRESALALTRSIVGAQGKRVRSIEARALLDLGRFEEARPIVMELVKAGFRQALLIDAWKAKGGVLDSALAAKSR